MAGRSSPPRTQRRAKGSGSDFRGPVRTTVLMPMAMQTLHVATTAGISERRRGRTRPSEGREWGVGRAGERLEHLQFPFPCLSFPHGITPSWRSEKGCYVDVKDEFCFCTCAKNNNCSLLAYCRLDPTRRGERIFCFTVPIFKFREACHGFPSRQDSEAHFTGRKH